MGYVLEGLYMNGTLFDFANAWSAQHDSIGPAKDFHLSEVDWQAFVQFAKDSESTTFESRTQTAWSELTALAREEQIYSLDSTAFDAFSQVLEPSIERDLNRFKEEITWALEEELVMRYHLQTGVIEWSIPRDNPLNKAIELMSTNRHLDILAGPTFTE